MMHVAEGLGSHEDIASVGAASAQLGSGQAFMGYCLACRRTWLGRASYKPRLYCIVVFGEGTGTPIPYRWVCYLSMSPSEPNKLKYLPRLGKPLTAPGFSYHRVASSSTTGAWRLAWCLLLSSRAYVFASYRFFFVVHIFSGRLASPLPLEQSTPILLLSIHVEECQCS